MEYRRRKSRRRSQPASTGGTAKAILALAVIAAIVYVVSASAVGAWVAEKVIAPAFAAFDSLVQGSAPAAPAGIETKAPVQQGGVSAAQAVTGDVQIPAMECFALQMGVFSTRENAQTEAENLRQRGAGGYVLEDAGKYRVLAAAYAGQESLKQVREQLKAEGMDSASYVFSAPNNTLRVTATQEQLDEVAAGFEALSVLLNDMAAATLQFDQQQMTEEQGRQSAAKLLEQLQAAQTRFAKLAAVENPVLEAASACYAECETALKELQAYTAQSSLDFSSKMKYTHICIVHAYAKLADQVAGL